MLLFYSLVFVNRRLFCDEFREWMSTITGIKFTDRVDLSCSKYEYTGMIFTWIWSID